MPDDSSLLTALEKLRDRGALGEPDLAAAIAHSERFVAAIPAPARTLLDLGSGGGLPGLVIALRRPDLSITLIDRRERRTDLLRLATTQLGIADRVAVITADVIEAATDSGLAGRFDVVTARAFGDPLWTLECAHPFLSETGVCVVSEPPEVDAESRWPAEEVSALGYDGGYTAAGVQIFRRVGRVSRGT